MTTGSITPVNAFTTAIPSMIDGQVALAADINGSIQALSNRSEFNKLANDTQDTAIASHAATLGSHTTSISTNTSDIATLQAAKTAMQRSPVPAISLYLTAGTYGSNTTIPADSAETTSSSLSILAGTPASSTDGDVDLWAGTAIAQHCMFGWTINAFGHTCEIVIKNGSTVVGQASAGERSSGVFILAADQSLSSTVKYVTLAIKTGAGGDVNATTLPSVTIWRMGQSS